MRDITIKADHSGNKGRYVARVAGAEDEAELTFSRASDRLIIVDHTGVPDSLRGKGLAAALAARAIEDARAAGTRIMPLCPFFRAYAMRHRAQVEDVVDL
ncbi:GNAT family N-acetyltransferase [Pacificoceanicola onchidii]|uniref:GNAT family N-acetyltransferase n=1 Tax=Pacificoceanicola onchidii TaxID=2562685 RepID=UPI00197FB6F3|nr:GNAT family N-acetyltransferase [Pacificoceanicola onchidii]